MEFHSFRFLSQMLSSKLTRVVFITPDSSKQLVCGADGLDFCLLRACTRLYIRANLFYFYFHTCARKSECIPSLCFVRREKCVSEPMLHTQQPCPIEIDWSHSGGVILACVCRPAIIFGAQRASSGFSLLLFVHNEINSFVDSQDSQNERLFVLSKFFYFLKMIFKSLTLFLAAHQNRIVSWRCS